MTEPITRPTYCFGHTDVKDRIVRIESIQRDRPCGREETRIDALERSVSAQWDDINSLKKTLYEWAGQRKMTAGMWALVGSTAGTIAVWVLSKLLSKI